MKNLLRLAQISAVAALVASLCGSAVAEDRKVKIINETNFDIVEFYGSHVGTDSWEEDILGQDVLTAGEFGRHQFRRR